MNLRSKYFYDDYSDAMMKLGSTPCIRLRRVLRLKSMKCSETCLAISTNGQYGNFFISLLSAIALARGIGMKRVVVKNNYLYMSRNFSYHDISIEITPNHENCYHYNFLYWPNEMKPLISKFMPRIRPEFYDALVENIPKVAMPDDGLVVHVRSGDVFRKVPHWKYGQPPCSYYLDVIRSRNWSKIVLLSQDKKNPCVSVLAKEIGEFHPRDLKEDLAYMITTKNLAISVSTLVNAAVTISRNIQSLFTFNHTRFIDIHTWNCVPTKMFKRKVLKYWRNNEEQRKILLSAKSCSKWEILPNVTSRNVRTNWWDIN